MRTCVGCRSRVERDALIRVVAHGGQAVVDDRAALPGRGAWVHPDSECIDRAISRRAFARALRTSVTVSTETLMAAAHNPAERILRFQREQAERLMDN